MEGVQILNQFEVVTKDVFNWQAFLTGVLVCVGLGIIIAIFLGFLDSDWSAFFISLPIFTVFGLFLGCLAGGALVREPVEYETRYEVTVSEEVNMKDFMDRYEIIETRGSIYTVREK